MLAQSGKLTQKDVNLVEQTFDKHIEDIQKMVMDYVKRVFSKINTVRSKQEIFDTLIDDELVRDRKEDDETKKVFDDFSEKIIALENKTVENIYEIIFSTTPTSKLLLKRDERFAILRRNIPENK